MTETDQQPELQIDMADRQIYRGMEGAREGERGKGREGRRVGRVGI